MAVKYIQSSLLFGTSRFFHVASLVIGSFLELTRQLACSFYDDLPTTPKLYANDPLPFPVEIKMQGVNEEKGKEKEKGYAPPYPLFANPEFGSTCILP